MFNKRTPKNKSILLLLAVFCLTLPWLPSLEAVEVKTKDIGDFKGFQEGTFQGTSLDSRGRLFIGPRIKPIDGPAMEYYLSLAVGQQGELYVGTGHNARVFRLDPSSAPAPTASADAKSGETAADRGVTEIFKSDELDVYALLARANGDVLVATSPDGKIYKIRKKGGKSETTPFFDPEEKFIWDLKEDLTGNIIAATGNSGGIYRLDPSGIGVNIFTSEDNHIISLYVTRSNSILAGSGDRGILYQIDNMKVKVLFDSPFEEIRGICEDKDGNIFFSATRGLKKQNTLDNAVVETFLKNDTKKKEKAPKERSILYCYRTDGVVERVWTSETEYIYSLCYDKKDNSVLVGTGNSGRVYRVDKEGAFSIVYESEAAQVYRIAEMGKGFGLITNNTATVAGIEDTLNSKGVYYSEIYDLEIQSRLGKIYWDAETPANTGVTLSVRTGNSNVPDGTWTKWSAPFTDSENSTIGTAGVRYFQVKGVLNSVNSQKTPYLNRFKVFYIQSNLKPRLKKIEINNPNKPVKSKNKVVVTPVKRKNKNTLVLKWEVVDPNKDKLKYNLFLKKESAKGWILFREDLLAPIVDLDARLFDDGKYRVKVVADDSLSNPPTMAKTDSLISSPFLLDSTAPVLKGFSARDGHIAFTVDDATSIVSGVLYSYDGKIWFPLFPTDTIADSKSEKYDFLLKGKKNYIFIKVMDEFENSKVFQKEL